MAQDSGMTKSDFEILLQKIGPRIQRKDKKFDEEIHPSIRAAVTLGYLDSGDFSLNFNSTDNIIYFFWGGGRGARKSIAFLCHYGFCTICTMHITQNIALDCKSSTLSFNHTSVPQILQTNNRQIQKYECLRGL